MQRPHARTLRAVCCPTGSSGRVALRPPVAVDVPLHRSGSCSCSQKRWSGSALSRSLVRLAAGKPSSVAIELLLSQHCSRPWAIRQLTVENAIRRRICQYRHGFSYASSATVKDDTLIIVSLEPVRMVTQINRKPLRAQEKSGHHNVPRRNQQVSRVIRSAHLCVARPHFPSGTFRTQILTTLQAFRQQKNLLINMQKVASRLPAQFPAAPPTLPATSDQPHHYEFPRVSFCCGGAQLVGFFFAFVKLPTNLRPCASARFKHCSTNS